MDGPTPLPPPQQQQHTSLSRSTTSNSISRSSSSYIAPLSAQTRSMARIGTQHNLAGHLASQGQGQRAVGGLAGTRRKRETTMMDSLMAVAGSDQAGQGVDHNNHSGARNVVRPSEAMEDQERPRKMAKTSSTAPITSTKQIPFNHPKTQLHAPKQRTGLTPSKLLSTPQKPKPFDFKHFSLPPGSPTVFLPAVPSPDGSDSSEDSIMLKPTPRKVIQERSEFGLGSGSGSGSGMKGIGGNGTNPVRRRLWVDESKMDIEEEDGMTIGALRVGEKDGPEPILDPQQTGVAQPILPESNIPNSSTSASHPHKSSFGPIRHSHTHSSSLSSSGLPRSGSSYALPTKSSLAAAAATAQTIGAKARALKAAGGEGSTAVKKGSAPPRMGSTGSNHALSKMSGSGSSLNLAGKSMMGPPRKSVAPSSLSGGLHRRTSTVGSGISKFDLAGIAEGEKMELKSAQHQPQQGEDVEMASPSKARHGASPMEIQPSQQQVTLPKLPTLSKLDGGIRKPSVLARSTQMQPPSAPSTSSPNIRRPSYPTTLGSGPLAKPTSRVVSNPVINKENLAKSNQHDILDGIATTSSSSSTTTMTMSSNGMRAVSDPFGAGLARSTSIRNGLGDDAAKGLTGLNAAMAKLQMMKAASGASSREVIKTTKTDGSAGGWGFPRASASSADLDSMDIDGQDGGGSISRQDMSLNSSTSSVSAKPFNSVLSRSRNGPPPSSYKAPSSESSAVGDSSLTSSIGPSGARRISGSATLRDLMGASGAGVGNALKGVTAFVDVRTAEGDDSSSIFAEMLKACGAKVCSQQGLSADVIISAVVGQGAVLMLIDWWQILSSPGPRPSVRIYHPCHLQIRRILDSCLVAKTRRRISTTHRWDRMGYQM